MKLHRKQFTTLALAALATGFLGSATAQSAYPSKTVTMVVPTAAGGTTDFVITAEVSQYRGSNYLTLRKVLKRVSNANITP